ncbi:hypothetical protein AB0B25_04360 [Nocardia sp. NPDC049190]|uniref:SMP-30/gluconolactonase/LRE family protein n=1 Tax=Nocardia sp. NPDC049190 TaxID=3155650 RepID=UPI0033FF7367
MRIRPVAREFTDLPTAVRAVRLTPMAAAKGSNRVRPTVLTVAVLAGIAAATPSAHAAAFPAACGAGWETTTVVEGVGNLENLDSDGAGGFYVTGIMDGYLAHVDSTGWMEKVVTGLSRPAGVRVAGPYVYFLTGDGLSQAPGTLQRYDTETRTVQILLTGLNGPNGLLLLPDGSFLFTTIGLGGPNGISRYRPETSEYERDWASLPPSNGIALAADGESIYVDTMTLQIYRIPLTDPGHHILVSGIPDLVALPDDMAATRAGALFVADHILGAVYQVDTTTGATCAIITGLIKPGPVRNPPDGATSVRIAPDAASWALFVTSMDGSLRRLRPPAGIDLTPRHAGCGGIAPGIAPTPTGELPQAGQLGSVRIPLPAIAVQSKARPAMTIRARTNPIGAVPSIRSDGAAGAALTFDGGTVLLGRKDRGRIGTHGGGRRRGRRGHRGAAEPVGAVDGRQRHRAMDSRGISCHARRRRNRTW